jgi:hypothetical protein
MDNVIKELFEISDSEKCQASNFKLMGAGCETEYEGTQIKLNAEG